MPASRLTPADKFFIRTEYPDLLRPADEWTIQLGGEVRKPQALAFSRLDRLVEPKGPVLLECSGNHRTLKYGLLSVAEWEGVPIGKVLDLAEPTNKATSVLINGFDDDSNLPDNGPPYSEHSMPTCSWIFTREQLEKAGAFLATRMNGLPLPKDHGKPVRLVVPGWYGCSEVKWVNEIKLVNNNQPATLQMLGFADRTGQSVHRDPSISTAHPVGPKMAREYVPASIDQAALPVRGLNNGSGTASWPIGSSASRGAVPAAAINSRFVSGGSIATRLIVRSTSARRARRFPPTVFGCIAGNRSSPAATRSTWGLTCPIPTYAGSTYSNSSS